MTNPMPIRTTVDMAASPEEIWAVLSDPRRMPEFSPELRRVIVIGGPGVGTRIVGINRRRAAMWPTLSRVTAFVPLRTIAWRTRESGATWTYEIEARGTGSRVTGSRTLPKFTVATALMGPLIGGAAGHDRELAAGIVTTLARIRAAVDA